MKKMKRGLGIQKSHKTFKGFAMKKGSQHIMKTPMTRLSVFNALFSLMDTVRFFG